MRFIGGKILALICFSVVFLTSTSSISHANEGFAEYVVIEQDTVLPGNIVVLQDNVYQKSQTAYSPNIAGVVVQDPSIAFGLSGKTNTYPITLAGTLPVQVIGEVEAGDFITTSDTAGVGMRATSPGTVLGIARESFSPTTPEDTGLILVSMNIQFASAVIGDEELQRSFGEHLRRILVSGAVAASTEPNTGLRYGVAALIGLLSLVFGFISSAQAANKGITAVGRNPLAKKTIIAGVILHLIVTLVIVAAGLSLSAFILAGQLTM